MTLDQIKKRVGKNIKYYDDTNGWVLGRDVTEQDVQDYVNEVYCEELFPMFARSYPHMFRQVGIMDSWIMTSTATSASTGTTLVITDAFFNNGMEGLIVYNSTDDTSVTLTTYLSTTSFTVDETIGDTWDGDTIYVLGQEFAFGGDATDLFTIESIGVKTQTTDTYFKKVEFRNKPDYYVEGNEIGSKADPVVYLTSINELGTMYNAIGISPKYDTKITAALEVNYIAKPSPITGSGATPIIPINESMITGATMKCFEKMQDANMAAYWEAKYMVAQKRDISRFRPQTTSAPITIKVNRDVYYKFRRMI